MTLARVHEILDTTIPRMEGWCTPEKAKHLAGLVLAASAQHPAAPLAVEIGVFGGRSLLALVLPMVLILNAGEAHGIDPYTAQAALEGINGTVNDAWWSRVDYTAIEAQARRHLAPYPQAKIIKARSQDVAANYADGCIDVLHIDGNHSAKTSQQDVALWVPKMRAGGYLAFDDINWPTTAGAQALLIEKGFERIEDHETWAVYRAPTASTP